MKLIMRNIPQYYPRKWIDPRLFLQSGAGSNVLSVRPTPSHIFKTTDGRDRLRPHTCPCPIADCLDLDILATQQQKHVCISMSSHHVLQAVSHVPSRTTSGSRFREVLFPLELACRRRSITRCGRTLDVCDGGQCVLLPCTHRPHPAQSATKRKETHPVSRTSRMSVSRESVQVSPPQETHNKRCVH